MGTPSRSRFGNTSFRTASVSDRWLLLEAKDRCYRCSVRYPSGWQHERQTSLKHRFHRGNIQEIFLAPVSESGFPRSFEGPRHPGGCIDIQARDAPFHRCSQDAAQPG